MATKVSELQALQITPGVQPPTDRTPFSTSHYTASDKIRFQNGVPVKIGGWRSVLFEYGLTIQGYARSMFSASLQNQVKTLIGTNEYLYYVQGQVLTNITPFQATAITIPNSLNTVYDALGSNPIATTLGSQVVTVQATSDIQAQQVGDTIQLSGATTVGGISNTLLNSEQVIRSINTSNNKFTFTVSSAATSTATGGGSSVVYASPLIVVGQTAHGLRNGDRVELFNATTTGGIPANSINQEFVIRVPSANKFYIETDTPASSLVSGGGGTAVYYFNQLDDGAIDQGYGQGYGQGYYGAGLYGVSKQSMSGIVYPRIWFFDRFADTAIMTPGNQGGLYYWTGSAEIAPQPLGQAITAAITSGSTTVTISGGTPITITNGYPITGPGIPVGATVTAHDSTTITLSAAATVTNGTASLLVVTSPQHINYAFVSNNIVVTFGSDNVPNRIFASDQSNPAQWISSSTNQVFEDDIEGAERLISHVPANGVNLIFTGSQTYIFSYIGLPLVWSTTLLDNSIGIIGPLARVSVGNNAYWMGNRNFYMWSGGNVTIIPANSQAQSTLLNYVFGNLNYSQASKCYAWYNTLFNEVWFHYPSASSTECDSVARVNLTDMTWSPDTFDRTCAEYPDDLLINPRMVSMEGILYIHETGTDADISAMTFTLTSNLRYGAKKNVLISGCIPDSTVIGTIQAQIQTYQYPQVTTATFDRTFDISQTMGQNPTGMLGRFWKYTWSGSELGQSFIMGQWMEYLQASSDN